jgi:hypothetical protein
MRGAKNTLTALSRLDRTRARKVGHLMRALFAFETGWATRARACACDAIFRGI